MCPSKFGVSQFLLRAPLMTLREVIIMTSDHTEICTRRARLCRDQAQAQPERREYWVEQAEEWDRRAKDGGTERTSTCEVHRGRMIPKPVRH